ncbi:hypothetical protein A0O28_0069540 [Trichoderma guizhouense]|uniref:Uncharacterized protein n=1 Tax=Trichoderma guizhouense TaxID=1491466 RepID=A0A1T3D0E2_9HYPO|nr:hypothetical protein A0O28_0069540 [Trichoderma guizhouense]
MLNSICRLCQLGGGRYFSAQLFNERWDISLTRDILRQLDRDVHGISANIRTKTSSIKRQLPKMKFTTMFKLDVAHRQSSCNSSC